MRTQECFTPILDVGHHVWQRITGQWRTHRIGQPISCSDFIKALMQYPVCLANKSTRCTQFLVSTIVVLVLFSLQFCDTTCVRQVKRRWNRKANSRITALFAIALHTLKAIASIQTCVNVLSLYSIMYMSLPDSLPTCIYTNYARSFANICSFN